MVNSILDEMRPTIRGLGEVRVSKDSLLEVVQKNRDEHRQIFVEALDNWYKQVVAKLEEMVSQAKKGPEAVHLTVGLPKPEDHTRDYDLVIKMLEMSQDEEFELTDREFAQYVMDEWGWQHAFLASNASYSRSAQDKLSSMS